MASLHFSRSIHINHYSSPDINEQSAYLRLNKLLDSKIKKIDIYISYPQCCHHIITMLSGLILC